MRSVSLFIIVLLAHNPVLSQGAGEFQYESIRCSVYSQVPPSPGLDHQPGLAGSFSGIIYNKLVIAGGTNFPGQASSGTNFKGSWD